MFVFVSIMTNNAIRKYQKSANRREQSMTEPAFYLQQNFSDFDEFCTNALNWDLDYRQLEAGSFTGDLLTFGNQNTIFSRAKLGRRMLQQGTSPQGLITFGLLANQKSNIYWRNIDISANSLFIFPPGGELHSISQSDFDVLVVSLTEEKLNQVCESLELPDFKTLIDHNEAFDCNPQLLSAFRRSLLAIEQELTAGNAYASFKPYLERLEHELAESLIRLVSDSQQHLTKKPTRKRDLALQSAELFIHESDSTVVTIPDLCNACNVSERTLEYAFRERYGMTPKAYTLVCRLNNVRKQLRAAYPENVKVSEIARQNGFWHMGQFSASYRKLFAELPSETLKQYN